MKKIIIIGMGILLFTACTSKQITPEKIDKIETAWTIGKIINSIFLSDKDKEDKK